MTACEIIEKLMYLDDQSCPCEANIPCPFYIDDEDSYTYCDGTHKCSEGMAIVLEKLLKEKKK